MTGTATWRVVAVEGASCAADSRGIKPIEHSEWVRLLLGTFLAPVRLSSSSGRARVEYLVSGEELDASTTPAARDAVRRAVAQDFAEIESVLEDHRSRIERVKDGDQSMDWTLFLDSYELLMATTVSSDPSDWVVTDEGLCAIRWGLAASEHHRPLLLWSRDELGRLRADVERRLGALPPAAAVDLRAKQVLEDLSAAGQRLRDAGKKSGKSGQSAGSRTRGDHRGHSTVNPVSAGPGPSSGGRAWGSERWLQAALIAAVALSVIVNVVLIVKWRGAARDLEAQRAQATLKVENLESESEIRKGEVEKYRGEVAKLNQQIRQLTSAQEAALAQRANDQSAALSKARQALESFASLVTWELPAPVAGRWPEDFRRELVTSLEAAYPGARLEVLSGVEARVGDQDLARLVGECFRQGSVVGIQGLGDGVRGSLELFLGRKAEAMEAGHALADDHGFATWASGLPPGTLRNLCDAPNELPKDAVRAKLPNDSPWSWCVSAADPDEAGRARYRKSDCDGSGSGSADPTARPLVGEGLPSCASGLMAFPRFQLHECVKGMLGSVKSQLEREDPGGLNDDLATILVGDLLEAATAACNDFSLPPPKDFQRTPENRRKKLGELGNAAYPARANDAAVPGRLAKYDDFAKKVQQMISSAAVSGQVSACRSQVERAAQIRPFGIIRDGRFASTAADGELPADWVLWELRVVGTAPWYQWKAPADGDTVGRWAAVRLSRQRPRPASPGTIEVLVAIPPAGRAASTGAVR